MAEALDVLRVVGQAAFDLAGVGEVTFPLLRRAVVLDEGDPLVGDRRRTA
jgi:hypothetical protein